MQEIGQDQPHRADLGTAGCGGRRADHDGKAEAEQKEGNGELGRAGRIAPTQADPKDSEDGREQDDEKRWQRLVPAGREATAKYDIVGTAIGEQVEGRAGLLVGHPEHHRGGEEDRDDHETLPFLAGPSAAQEEPGEERHRHRDQNPLEVPGDRLRIETH